MNPTTPIATTPAVPPAPTGPINYAAAAPYQQAAQTAQQNVANLTESGPGLLQALQQNLTKIFTTDNPILNAREGALSTYLSTPSATRAATLPSNLPIVAGSQLNLSPTQQNTIVSGRLAAALAPLAGLNQAVVGMYGTIPQLVGRAGDIYSSLIGGATTRANIAQKQYEDIIGQAQAQEDAKLRQLQIYLTASTNQPLRANRILAAAANDARSGATLDRIMATYGNNIDVTPDQLLQAYKNNTIYGAVRESPTELVQRYHVTPQGAGVIPLQPISVRAPGPIPYLPNLFPTTTTQFFNPVTNTLSLPGGGSSSQAGTQVRLRDPNTNQVYQWNQGDPEIGQALNAGWQPVQ